MSESEGDRAIGGLRTLMAAARPLSGKGIEGSHTDVFRFDAEALGQALPGKQGAALAEWIGARYLVKKGKIDVFAQPLLGSEPTRIRRTMVSWVFGPLGFSVLPTFEKTLQDATEAVRTLPYLGVGDPAGFFAPDLVQAVSAPRPSAVPAPNADATVVRTLMAGVDLRHSAWRLLEDDPFFLGASFDDALAGPANLAAFQAQVRRAPLTPGMEERFADFFQSPITVGFRDILRWLNGSRHPNMGWAQARAIIRRCFERHGDASFVLPEITYYSYDTDLPAADLAARVQANRTVAAAFVGELLGVLPEPARLSLQRVGAARVAFELLDFLTDYRRYELEPYAGFLTASAARTALRFSVALALEVAGLPVPGEGNTDVARLPPFLAATAAWLGAMPADDRADVEERLGDLLAKARGRRALGGRFQTLPRTFYTFQARADQAGPGRRVTRLVTLRDLWLPENDDLWRRYPTLAEKLVVFFTVVYRYFDDTGYVADLRPRDSGRDIFLYGIWGYITENVLIVEEEGPGGPDVRVVFVDNRDQFKQHRGDVDRRHPIGMAKYALHLVQPIIEPALVRSVGLFAERVRVQEEGKGPAPSKDPVDWVEHGLDIARTVAKEATHHAFVQVKAAVDDLIDDAHTGATRSLRQFDRATRKRRVRR